MKKWIIVAVFSLLLPCTVFADYIELNSGKKITGKIVKKDDNVVKIDVDGNSSTYSRNKIRSIYQEDADAGDISLYIHYSKDEKGTKSEVVMPTRSSDPDKWENAFNKYENLNIPDMKEDEGQPIEVEDSADVSFVRRFGMDIGLGLMMSCTAEMSRELQAKGKQSVIVNIMMDENKKKIMQHMCLCENKVKLSERIKELDAVLLRHPEWKGKKLIIKKDNMTETLGVMDNIKDIISQCDTN